MKKISLLTLAVTLGLLGSGTGNLQAASVNSNAVLITFQVTAAIQQVSAVTNHEVVTTTASATTVSLDNEYLLNLLQAEFGTSFPIGAQLALNLTGTPGFHVLDVDGNPVLNVSYNPSNSGYLFTISNNVAGAVAPELIIGKDVLNTVTSNQTTVITFIEPDYGVYYRDGNGNNFHVDGLLKGRFNFRRSPTNSTYDASFTITGSGGGAFFNPKDGMLATGVFIKARVSAKGQDIRE